MSPWKRRRCWRFKRSPTGPESELQLKNCSCIQLEAKLQYLEPAQRVSELKKSLFERLCRPEWHKGFTLTLQFSFSSQDWSSLIRMQPGRFSPALSAVHMQAKVKRHRRPACQDHVTDLSVTEKWNWGKSWNDRNLLTVFQELWHCFPDIWLVSRWQFCTCGSKLEHNLLQSGLGLQHQLPWRHDHLPNTINTVLSHSETSSWKMTESFSPHSLPF